MASSRHADDSRRFGLIILGNSGVGKSFIANLFLANETFVHRSRPTAVTTVTEFEEYTLGDDTYVIFNIPGLIEAKQSQIDRNKQEIDKAFKECPNSIVIYVFGVNNGRVRNEDIIAFNALHSAYPFEPKSLVLIINNTPPLNQREDDYEGETIVLLRDVLDLKTFKFVCFLDTIDVTNNFEKRRLRAKLLPVVTDSLPKVHIKQHDIQVQTDQVAALIAHFKDMINRFESEKRELHAEFRLAQKQHQKELKEQQQRFGNLQEQLITLQKRKQSNDDGCCIL